jgi:phosphonate transport system permease protein
MGQILFDALSFAYLALFAVLVALRPSGEVLVADLNWWTAVFFGLLLIGLVVAFVGRGRKTLGAVIYGRRSPAVVVPFYRTIWGLQTTLILFVTLVHGFFLTEFSFVRLVEADSLRQALRLFSELASPDWSVLPKAVVKIIESIFIAFMATALAFPFAFVLCFFASRNLMAGSRAGLAIYYGLRFLFNVTRSVEPVLWAILFSIWVSFGPFAGMLALMVHSVASLAKQYSEIVEGVEDGPIQGIEATGASRFQVVWFAVVPQVVLPFISFTIYRWDTNLRMATILGFVGGGGIGAMLMEYQGQARWPQVGTIIVVIAAVVWILDAFSAQVRAAAK